MRASIKSNPHQIWLSYLPEDLKHSSAQSVPKNKLRVTPSSPSEWSMLSLALWPPLLVVPSLVDLGVVDKLVNQADTSRSLTSFVETVKSLTSPSAQPTALSPTQQPCPLTQLLREALGGNCKTLLLCDVPEQLSTTHYEACIEALSLASQSRLIENKPDRTELARKALMDAYMKELRRIHGSGDLKRAVSAKKDGIQLAANALVAAAKGSASIEANGEEEEDTDEPSLSMSQPHPGKEYTRYRKCVVSCTHYCPV